MTIHEVAVSSGTPYQTMAGLIREHHVSGFPVVDEAGTVLGVVSETDLVAGEEFPPALAIARA
jgi:CBS domain-containing protein